MRRYLLRAAPLELTLCRLVAQQEHRPPTTGDGRASGALLTKHANVEVGSTPTALGCCAAVPDEPRLHAAQHLLPCELRRERCSRILIRISDHPFFPRAANAGKTHLRPDLRPQEGRCVGLQHSPAPPLPSAAFGWGRGGGQVARPPLLLLLLLCVAGAPLSRQRVPRAPPSSAAHSTDPGVAAEPLAGGHWYDHEHARGECGKQL